MRAVVFRGKGVMRLDEVLQPQPAREEALLRVGAAGICGTDLRILANGHHRIPPGTPRILGHELAGEIVEVGEAVQSLTPGMHVGIAPNIGCGTCQECVSGWTNLCPDYNAFGISLDGAFAEYMLIPADAIRQGNLVPIPERIPHHEATLAEPLSCCLNGQEAVDVGPDDMVLVVGAGPIGIMHLLLAKLRGARKVLVAEVSQARLDQAREYGADILINPNEQDLRACVREATRGRGVDVAIVAAASAEAQQVSLELSAPRGRPLFFGGLRPDDPYARLNSNLIHYKQLVVTGTTGSTVRQYRSAMHMITEGRIRVAGLVSGRLPLDRFREGFDRTKSAGEMRIVLEPQVS